jgi:hypothetical protein
MAKKPTKKEIQAAAAAVVNEHLAAGTADQIPLETILLTLPGGAGGEAQIYACQSLKKNPGMTMEALQTDACAEAELNYSTAGWIVGREWGNYKGFGGLDYLWERRHEKLAGDKRARWHYYLLPAGETLAKADPSRDHPHPQPDPHPAPSQARRPALLHVLPLRHEAQLGGVAAGAPVRRQQRASADLHRDMLRRHGAGVEGHR